MSEIRRCDWANVSEIDTIYHDEEWGVPVHDEQLLFEILTLESMQAGLSWSTILKKRETMREAFDSFDYQLISTYTEDKIEELLQNKGIIRHRQKISAMINNAQQWQKIQKKYGSFDTYIWSFVNNQPIINHWEKIEEVPSTTPLSENISKELKREGFKFVGPTTVYAFLQAAGLVNDHLIYCFKSSPL